MVSFFFFLLRKSQEKKYMNTLRPFQALVTNVVNVLPFRITKALEKMKSPSLVKKLSNKNLNLSDNLGPGLFLLSIIAHYYLVKSRK